MRFYRGISILFAGLFAASAQNIELTGTISTSGGNPIPNAIVTLLGKNIADTTSIDGSYSITHLDNSATTVFRIPHIRSVSLKRGVLQLNLPRAEPFKIELFDVKGTLIEKINKPGASAGIYYFDMSAQARTSRMMLIRIAISETFSIFRYMPLQQQVLLINQSVRSSEHFGLSKQLAEVDSLQVIAEGYYTKMVTISTYNDQKDIVLDPVLDHFSFFVTSYESLVELSKSKDGFGGDLRFGFTGPGAGLRGADSICECLAEMSMKGSKTKQWRAFLSVKADEGGNQVDARDRIGNGPWYDRQGRVMALSLDSLIQERPLAENDIKNDLPNEFGVPNRYPDPTSDQSVDNHHMLTGSDTEGRLYESNGQTYTCQDWTSVSANDKARFGLSWPRDYGRWDFPKVTQMGGGSSYHWISSSNTSGCEAGADLNGASIVGERDVYTVGNGGGYGGFYCFALNP